MRVERGPTAVLLVALLLMTACAGGTSSTTSATMISGISGARAGGGAEAAISELVTVALASDARGEDADSLYAPDAIVVAQGTERFGAPRFAGVERGGEVAITTSRIVVRPGLTWADVEYRWLSTEANQVRGGRATILVTPGEGGAWRIVHAHSSVAD